MVGMSPPQAMIGTGRCENFEQAVIGVVMAVGNGCAVVYSTASARIAPSSSPTPTSTIELFGYRTTNLLVGFRVSLWSAPSGMAVTFADDGIDLWADEGRSASRIAEDEMRFEERTVAA